MVALTGAGEEPGEGASSGKSPQQQRLPGTGASSGENFQPLEAPEKRRLRRKVMEEPGARLSAPPPSSRGAPHGANEVTAEKRLAITEAPRDRQDKTPGATAVLIVAGESPGTGASSSEGSKMHMVCVNPTSRTRTAGDREALASLVMKNCKWEQLNWAEMVLETEAYQRLRNVARKINVPEIR